MQFVSQRVSERASEPVCERLSARPVENGRGPCTLKQQAINFEVVAACT